MAPSLLPPSDFIPFGRTQTLNTDRPPPHAPSLKLVAFRHRLNLYLHSGPSGGDYSEGGKVFTYKVPVEFMYIGRTDLTLRER